ncbi:MAG: tRNA pseudouridine(38-40) synthase TruA [Verrucomicrobia bacterium]|jgi:tRNA pseudouridine38-40 synthase|nr:tRNA pseudouridine(38-40) synthase TruA [Verrucomicrobiota bacterium]
MSSIQRNIKLKFIIAYHGEKYQGWQTQKTGVGVQSVIEDVLRKFFPNAGTLWGSSRTDTGVHALGMVAHIEMPAESLNMATRKIRLAVNANLPRDIRVISTSKVPLRFNAQFDAKGKQYKYRIWNHASMNPLLQGLAWQVPVKLDLKLMQEASRHFLGERDFQSFASNRSYAYESTVRTLTRCDVRKQGYEFRVIIEGNGFLYKMCRGIVGTLAAVGKGKWVPDDIPTLLTQKNRSVSGMNAPACGLTLHKVFY